MLNAKGHTQNAMCCVVLFIRNIHNKKIHRCRKLLLSGDGEREKWELLPPACGISFSEDENAIQLYSCNQCIIFKYTRNHQNAYFKKG